MGRRRDPGSGSYLSAVVAAVAVVGGGCSAMPELPGPLGGDWEPAVLSAVVAADPATVALEFSEPVTLERAELEPPRAVTGSVWEQDRLLVSLDTALDPGREYWIDAVVRDEAGNTSSVLVSVWGLNPRLPPMLINEVVCEGSGDRNDWVELRVLAAGNVGGATLYEGVPGEWDSRAVLPPIEVSADDFIVVHFKPDGSAVEITEITDRSASGGSEATATGWDVWVAGGDGIPNSTGALTLTDSPDGALLDALLYSTRLADPTDENRGFGTAEQLRLFDAVVRVGGWVIGGEQATPSDGFNPEDSTATRSISRTSDGRDSDSAADWHITPTRGATPGAPNTDEQYAP